MQLVVRIPELVLLSTFFMLSFPVVAENVPNLQLYQAANYSTLIFYPHRSACTDGQCLSDRSREYIQVSGECVNHSEPRAGPHHSESN